MVRRYFLIFLFAVAYPALAQNQADLRSVVSGPEQAPELVETAEDPIEAAIQAMSLEQKIAQLMFVTFDSGHSPGSGERRLLTGYTPGGVFLPSVVSPAAFELYVRDLRRNPVEERHRVPILIGTNFFALAAQRHPASPYSPLPSLLTLGATHDESKMESAAELIADYVNVLGVGLHFGPSLSLSSRIPGTAPGYHQFGEDPSLVAMGARAFGNVFAEQNVNWMPMGFPGGDTNRRGADPPVLVTPETALDQTDLLPFKEAIAAGARFMHVSNVLVPTLEEEPVPASVSYSVLTKLLRDRLGFEGIVVAGPMDDPDLVRFYDGPNAPVRALMAGADMVWWGAAGPRPEQFVGQLAVAVQEGQVPESIIEERLRRVLQVKQDLALIDKPLPSARDIGKLIKEQDGNEMASELEEAGIVVLKASPALFPISKERSIPLGITGVAGVSELYDIFEEEKIEPLARYNIASAKHGKQIFGFEIERLVKGAAGTRTLICIFGADIHGPTQREILRQFKQFGTRTVTVLLGIPDDIDKYIEDSDALIVILRQPDQPLGSAMSALADLLLGRGSVRILEPTRDLVVSLNESIAFDISGIAVTPAARLPISASELLPAGTGVGFSAPMDKRKVTWDFGDGTNASGPIAQHAYQAPGTYTVGVNVIEDGQSIADGSYTVVVRDAS